MTFEEIMEILKSAKTDYQKAADLHAAIQTATRPSALTLQPQKTRKPRMARAKPPEAPQTVIDTEMPTGI